MTHRTDRKRIVVVGGGPRTVGTTFGRACAAALVALRREGYETVSVDASAMSLAADPALSDRTYVEPLEPRTFAAILAKEAPDAVAMTFGGPRAASLVRALAVDGTLERLGIDVLGVDRALARRFDDPELWAEPVARAGLRSARAHDAQVRGWKAYEVHALHDGVATVTVGEIEGVDPVGVHAEDALSVTPPMTLDGSVRETLERSVHAMMTALGGYRGALAVRFAVDPATGDVRVVDASMGLGALHGLASAASGFDTVTAAVKVALGRRIDELEAFRATRAAMGADRASKVVVRWPRFSFDRFEGADDALGAEKKSIGAALGIGTTFADAFRKAARSLEAGFDGLGANKEASPALAEAVGRPSERRWLFAAEALRRGTPTEDVARAASVDPWFVDELRRAVDAEAVASPPSLAAPGEPPADGSANPGPSPPRRPTILVLGAGPEHVGRDTAFDECILHVTKAAAERGFDAIVLDANAELSTVTGATRTYVEPPTLDVVSAIFEAEKPVGILLSFGGRTAFGPALAARGLPVFGPPVEILARLGRRGTMHAWLDALGLDRPRSLEIRGVDEAATAASSLGFPVLVGPAEASSGAGAKIVRSADELASFVARAAQKWRAEALVVESFVEGAVEVDVDAVSDGTRAVIGGILEHLERAGVHPADAAAILPPFTLSPMLVERIEHVVRHLAVAGGLVGPVHVRLAVQDDRVLVLDVRAEAGRTVPFVSRATGIDLAAIATKVLLGATLDALGVEDRPVPRHVAAKETVFPFGHLRTDTVLGPGAHATGEVLGIDATPARAYQKALRAIGAAPSRSADDRTRDVVLAVTAQDERPSAELARRLRALGFDVLAVGGVARTLAALRIPHRSLDVDGAVRAIGAGTTAFAIVTAEGDDEVARTSVLRRAALARGVTCFTTLPLARLGCAALEENPDERRVTPLQEWYARDV